MIVNACDAGREGELIFAYVYETSKVEEAGEAAVAVVDDAQGDPGGVQRPARRRGDEAARGGRALALRGRLARGDERHPRGLDPAAGGVRRRGVAGPRADADARAGRPARAGDPRLHARALLARGGEVRGDRDAPLRRPLPGRQAHRGGARPATIVDATSRASRATITKLEKKEEREQPQLLYDLTTLQRHANTLYGFSARRTLAAAQRLYEEHKAITYPRTNSRFLTGDLVAEIKPTAELVGPQRAVPQGRRVRARRSRACRCSAW